MSDQVIDFGSSRNKYSLRFYRFIIIRMDTKNVCRESTILSVLDESLRNISKQAEIPWRRLIHHKMRGISIR